MTDLTVLMPVYNGERYLREAVASILDQTHRDFEFLIIDDGSCDRSVEIIEGFSDQRIRLLRNQRRLRLSGALNRGLAHARGALIARMDADDIALPERLSMQVQYLKRHPDVGICGTWIKKFSAHKKEICRFPLTHEQIRSYALFDCPFAHPTVMIRKSFFDDHGLRYDGAYYPTEDYELWSRAMDCFKGANIGKVLLQYRVHQTSMTGGEWGDMDHQATAIAEKQLLLLGIQCGPQEILHHRQIGRGASVKCHDLEALQAGERWLLGVMAANERTRRYEREALFEAVALVWFRLCFNSAALGMDTFSKYVRSPLTSGGKQKQVRILQILGAVIKHILTSSMNSRN